MIGAALTSAVHSIRRSPYQALAAVLLIMVTTTVGYALSYALVGAHLVLRYYETQPPVIAFFKKEVPPETIQAVSNELVKSSFVKSVNITTQQQALEIYRQEYQNQPLLLELVTASMLPASLDIYTYQLNDLTQVKNALTDNPAIEKIIFQQQVIDEFNRLVSALRLTGIISAAVLTLLSYLVTTIVIGMKVHSHKQTISVSRLLGATKLYVTLPYVMEGALYGLMGSSLGWLVAFLCVLYIAPGIQSYVSQVPLYPLSVSFVAIQATVGLSASMLVGSLAGQSASSRLVKQ